ncbi:hypothetical protein QAD02_016158 [Eretmocerus hayati]|uniref:Uncharacterized protein n=1 Tax=Eretmocerus hayati TaxID=131215 RepID=A0ACC2PBL1_9HYME|nr:hypothetical protein QAD02_016158 [Eretmocerus hayati]
MDPFTQRMLERAKARREKLDTALTNAGHEVHKRRSPLRDANVLLAQAPVATDVSVKRSPSKLTKNSISPTKSPVKSPRKSPDKNVERTSYSHQREPNKENNDHDKSPVKSKLQRMGKLYSDDDRALSSPIHRTEENFTAEDDDTDRALAKPGARLNRLAALASEINNWEDDLSHPTVVKQTTSKAERVQAKLNESVRSGSEPRAGPSGLNKMGSCTEKSSSPMRWEKTTAGHMGSHSIQYRSPTKSSPIKSPVKSPVKSPMKTSGMAKPSALEKIDERPGSENRSSVVSSPASSYSSNQYSKSPEKAVKSAGSGSAASSPAVSSARLNSRFGYNGSPKSSHVQSPGSVLSKASMFESKNSSVKTKDPAEMSLSERKALFERNKGEALIPKAPLTMSVPTKMLQEKSSHSGDSSSSCKPKTDTGRAVEAQRSIFEQGKRVQELENDILQNVQAERQRELEMLRSRFNRTRDVVRSVNPSLRTSESSDQGKATSPKNSPVCPVKPTPAPDQAPPPPPPMPALFSRRSGSSMNSKNSPPKRQVAASPPKVSSQMKKTTDIKRIKVAPPKPGCLYPNLADIESSSTETFSEYTAGSSEPETATFDEQTNTETETEAEYLVQTNDSEEYTSTYDDDDDYGDDDIGNTSLGRSILQAVSQQTTLLKKRSIEPDPDSTTSDISVLDEMDEYLDECLAAQEYGREGPSPAKLNKSGKSPSAASRSFKYTHGTSYRSPIKIVSPASSPKRRNQYVMDGDDRVPLLHSVSTYRRQQSQTPKSSARLVSRMPENIDSNSDEASGDREAALIQEKVKRLLDEVQKQQTTMGEASKAVNICDASFEFSGSRAKVDGERALLVASERRKAALEEIQRLKVEGSLRPVVPGSSEVQESGSLTISAVTLPLKRDFSRYVDPKVCLHFVCLVRHLDTVIATPAIQGHPGDSCIRFPSTLKLQDLYSDFKVTIEVYSLETRTDYSNGKKKTPKKSNKQSNKLVMQSPAGPSAVRTTSFSRVGFVVFSLKDVSRQQFTLSNISLSCPLEGRLQMHVSCELAVSVSHRGFLTMFEDVSGFGAWHRRHCVLEAATLSYWTYPSDEQKKTPIGSIDLRAVTTANVNLVSRDICARPNTFLLETTRPAHSGDTDSLVMVRNGPNTTIRHLISADTKEDRLEWCAKLNKTLHLLRAWGTCSS